MKKRPSLFYVGTSPRDAYMLPDRCKVMLNVSQFYNGRSLPKHNKPYRAYNRLGSLFLDSGGFVFFNRHGEYPFTIKEYAAFIGRLQPDLFATMDYPCEETITSNLDNLSTAERITKTVNNAAELLAYFPADLGPTPIPVIQGYTGEEYAHCIDLHEQAGTIRPFMAVGSMCNRSNSKEIIATIRDVHQAATAAGVQRLHFFGLKLSPQLDPVQDLIYSRDSAAVYFAPNKQFKAQWGGKHFAPNRAAKQAALNHWLNSISRKGHQWQ